MGYAFISYSTKNQSIAESMRDLLNRNGIETWMAPGNIPVGMNYVKGVSRAIKECACVILMLSNAAQESVWVPKEIERAVHYRKVIVPIQIEDLVLNEEFEMYVGNNQIVAIQQIDSNTPEIREVLNLLKTVCGGIEKTAYMDNPQVNRKEPSVREEAKDETDPEICFQKGYECYIQQDYAQCVEWFRKAAEQNYPMAQVWFGWCYGQGIGVEKDLEQEAQWYRRAADQNYPEGQWRLGYCYDFRKDAEKAVEWYRKAAEQNSAEAQYRLGWCYKYGNGVAQNCEQGIEWFRRAAYQNHEAAQYSLGECYYYGDGVEKDYQQATYWFRKVIEQKGFFADEARKRLQEMGVEE